MAYHIGRKPTHDDMYHVQTSDVKEDVAMATHVLSLITLSCKCPPSTCKKKIDEGIHHQRYYQLTLRS